MSSRLGCAIALFFTSMLSIGCSLVQEATDPFAATGGGGGGIISFASMRDGDYEIYLMEADGANLTRLTDHPALDVSPTWSPDGSQIAFSTQRADLFSREIFVMDATGANLVNISRFPVSENNPCWSPDGTRIAFDSMRDGNNEIYVMDSDGSNQIRLTDSPGFDSRPSWSPDGQKIIFESGRTVFFHESQEADSAEVALLIEQAIAVAHGRTNFAFKHQIYVMDADGSSLIRLTNNPYMDTHPAWSPDGSRVAFVSDRSGDRDIYLMAPDGSELVNLTNNQFSDTSPAWSPDGRRIAFVSDRHGHPDIFVMNADGSNPINLTQSDRNDMYPAWMPGNAYNTRDRCLLCPGPGGPQLGF